MLSESASISDNDLFGESFGITRVDIPLTIFVFDIHHLLLLSISNLPVTNAALAYRVLPSVVIIPEVFVFYHYQGHSYLAIHAFSS